MSAEETARLSARLPYFAWRWYRIPTDTAEDVVQAALLTYIEVKERYPDPQEHRAILVGIFRNKCREHIAKDVRAARGLRSLRLAAETGDSQVSALPTERTPEDGVLHALVHREDGQTILAAMGELKPSSREMLRLIGEEGCSRKELSKRYRVSTRTLDSRLHSARNELRKTLAKRGVQI